MTAGASNPENQSLYAREAFSFLESEGFSVIRESSPASFMLTYNSAIHPISVLVGALLPRYEYGVSISCDAQRMALDEVASVLDASGGEAVGWTWAHSDPEVFRAHISYSAKLLRRHWPHLLKRFQETFSLVADARSKAAELEHVRQLSCAADDAFAAGRWAEASTAYRALPTLTQLQQKRKEIADRQG